MRIKKLIQTLEHRDNLLEQLSSQKMFKRMSNVHTIEDRHMLDSFFRKFIKVFRALRQCAGSTYPHKTETLVFRYIAVQNYFYTAGKIYEIIGEHKDFVEQYVDENKKRSIRKLRKHLMSPEFRTYRHIPSVFIRSLRKSCRPQIAQLLEYQNAFNIDTWEHIYQDWMNVSYFSQKTLKKTKAFWVKKIGMGMTHLKLKRRNRGLITSELVKQVLPGLKAGDILITRSNWYPSNVSIPGFWKHMSIYIGGGQIIESVGSGIHKTPLVNLLLNNDYFCAFRTGFTQDKIDRALSFVGAQIGKEYDFHFNYHSSRAMVCSELVTKAYLPDRRGAQGLNIQLSTVGGSLSYPPNDLIRKCQEELGTKTQQLTPIAFIDSSEKKEEAFISTPLALLNTWKRSRFSFWQK